MAFLQIDLPGQCRLRTIIDIAVKRGNDFFLARYAHHTFADLPPGHLQQCLWMAAHIMASQLRAYEGLGEDSSKVNCPSALANDESVSTRTQAETGAMQIVGRNARSVRECLEAFEVVVRSLVRSLQSAQQGPPDIGNHDLTVPLHLSNQNHLTLNAPLHFQHTPPCHFQGFVSRNLPPTIAAWCRWQPLTCTGRHRFTGRRAEDVQQFVSAGRCRDVPGSYSDRLGTTVLQRGTRKTDLLSLIVAGGRRLEQN